MNVNNQQAKVYFPSKLRQKYIVDKEIGSGAYGKVWRGFDKRTNKPVAIKGFTQMFNDHVDAKRILREIVILGQINHHDHIIKLLDVICPDDVFRFNEIFIVLEYGDCDLRNYIKHTCSNGSFIPIVIIKRIMYQILRGLATIKRYGIIHRDFKPSNILIVENNHVKICDFGLARDLVNLKTKQTTETKRKHYDELEGVDNIRFEAPNSNKYPLKQIKVEKKDNKTNQAFYLGSLNLKGTKKKNLSSNSFSVTPARKEKSNNNNIDFSFGKKNLKINIMESEENHSNSFSNVINQFHTSKTPVTTTSQKISFDPQLKKCLTHHIVTRWYRSPEIILIEDYDYKADVWAAGCILLELLGVTFGAHLHGPIFPGSSCYPMSPVKKSKSKEENSTETKETPKIVFDPWDQLNLILNFLGSPNKEDMDFIKHSDRKKYLESFGEIKGVDISAIYPEASREAVDLIKKMLKFNPKERIDVEECLKHPFFENVSAQEELPNIPEQICLDFEHDNLHLCSFDLRALFLREVNKFQKIDKFDETFGFIINEITTIAKYGKIDL